MAIKDLDALLKRYTDGEIKDVSAFEAELNKSLAVDWVPKSTFNETNEKLKLAEKQSKDSASQLEELRSRAGLADEYKTKIDELTASQKKEREDYEKNILDLKHGYALDNALTASKAKNIKALKGMLDMSKISFDGDTIKGLDEQIEAIKKSDAYLFDISDDVEEPDPTPAPKPTFGSGLTKGEPQPSPKFSAFEAKMRQAAGLPV